MIIFLLLLIAYGCAKPFQSCLTLCDPTDHSLSGSSDQGILQARILEWVAMSSSRGSSQPGTKPMYLMSPALQECSLPLAPHGEPLLQIGTVLIKYFASRMFFELQTDVRAQEMLQLLLQEQSSKKLLTIWTISPIGDPKH